MARGVNRQALRNVSRGKGTGSESSSWMSFLTKPLIGVTVVLLILVVGLFNMNNDIGSTFEVAYLKGSLSGMSSMAMATSFDYDSNKRTMDSWRKDTEQKCAKMMLENGKTDSAAARAQKEKLERESLSTFTFPVSVASSLPSSHEPYYRYCRNVFIDLGTNIGDSIGFFVDNALDVCTAPWLQALPKTKLDSTFPRPHLDVTTLEVSHIGSKNNPLYGMLQGHMKGSVSPNSFCVYGMEGNPTFTERLQKLENHVMETQPRPVQHLHIHTESVVTSIDGPTKLYLDKTSVKENFWGSSILASQQDAVKSAKELGNGEVFSADVEGISLTTLARNTALAFKPNATPEEQEGGLMIIKMDVEGAEYQVLKDVAASGVLCDLVQKGNRVVMIVEFHNMSITDAAERRREKTGANEAKESLAKCGVQFGNLQASWH